MAVTIPSPCIQRCQLDKAGETCLGCRRTLAEITAWRELDDEAKQAVWARLLSLPMRVEDKHCRQCGQAFVCGAGGETGACWCSDLPLLMPLSDIDGDCLCPRCLQSQIEQQGRQI